MVSYHINAAAVVAITAPAVIAAASGAFGAIWGGRTSRDSAREQIDASEFLATQDREAVNLRERANRRHALVVKRFELQVQDARDLQLAVQKYTLFTLVEITKTLFGPTRPEVTPGSWTGPEALLTRMIDYDTTTILLSRLGDADISKAFSKLDNSVRVLTTVFDVGFTPSQDVMTSMRGQVIADTSSLTWTLSNYIKRQTTD